MQRAEVLLFDEHDARFAANLWLGRLTTGSDRFPHDTYGGVVPCIIESESRDRSVWTGSSLEFSRIVMPDDDERRSGETVTAKSLSLVVKSIIHNPWRRRSRIEFPYRPRFTRIQANHVRLSFDKVSPRKCLSTNAEIPCRFRFIDRIAKRLYQHYYDLIQY